MIRGQVSRQFRSVFTLLAAAAAMLLAQGSLAQGSSIAAVSAEPDHKIRFDNGVVRVYEVFLPAGRSTLMHEHTADNFSVMFGTSEMTNEPLGGVPATYQPPSGFVLFNPAPKPYSHRVTASGAVPFHVSALELLRPPRSEKPAGPRNGSVFKVELENQRGRVYRYTLEPGQSTGVFSRSGQTAIFGVAGGRISETAEGKPPRLWDFDPGHFRWIETAERLSVRNEGATKVHLVEMEVF